MEWNKKFEKMEEVQLGFEISQDDKLGPFHKDLNCKIAVLAMNKKVCQKSIMTTEAMLKLKVHMDLHFTLYKLPYELTCMYFVSFTHGWSIDLYSVKPLPDVKPLTNDVYHGNVFIIA